MKMEANFRPLFDTLTAQTLEIVEQAPAGLENDVKEKALEDFMNISEELKAGVAIVETVEDTTTAILGLPLNDEGEQHIQEVEGIEVGGEDIGKVEEEQTIEKVEEELIENVPTKRKSSRGVKKPAAIASSGGGSSLNVVADAGSALGSAVYCLAKCETLLNAANEEICDQKALVSVLCKLKVLKDNLGSLLDEFTRAVSKVDKDSMGQIMIDDYFVKTEMNEGETEHMDNDLDDQYYNDFDYGDDGLLEDDGDDKDFLPPSKIKAEGGLDVKPRYKRKHICDSCDMRFHSVAELEEHQIHCEPKGSYKCVQCDKMFTNDKRLSRHVQLKHMDLKCEVCLQVFDNKRQLVKHRAQEKHYTDDKKIFCDKCDKVLLSSKAYKMHVEQFHSKKHICSVCNQAFDILKELRVHMKDIHSIKLKNFACGTCGEIYHDVASLQAHMAETNHSTSSTCEVCGKVCASEGTLKVHMKIKHSQKFKCEECGEVLESKMDMRKHKAAKHAPEQPSQYVCQTCGHSTKNKDAFRHHLKIHQAKKHKCDVCEKMFTLKHSLTTHYRIHTGEKPLVCQVCGMRFRKSSGLCQHRAIHTGEKPYVCSVCGKGFVQKGGLKTHMKSHISGSLPMQIKE